MKPAGFARRYAAWSLDAALCAAVATLACLPAVRAGIARADDALQAVSATMAAIMLDAMRADAPLPALARILPADDAWRAGVRELAAAVSAAVWPPLLLAVPLALAYHALCEASPLQGTPGKGLLGLRVTGLDGGRIGLARALLRQLAGLLSWLTLNIGHLLAATPPHLALHDRLASTRVLQPEEDALPAWAKLWIAAQAVAAVAAAGWTLGTANAALGAALDRLLPPLP